MVDDTSNYTPLHNGVLLLQACNDQSMFLQLWLNIKKDIVFFGCFVIFLGKNSHDYLTLLGTQNLPQFLFSWKNIAK